MTTQLRTAMHGRGDLNKCLDLCRWRRGADGADKGGRGGVDHHRSAAGPNEPKHEMAVAQRGAEGGEGPTRGAVGENRGAVGEKDHGRQDGVVGQPPPGVPGCARRCWDPALNSEGPESSSSTRVDKATPFPQHAGRRHGRCASTGCGGRSEELVVGGEKVQALG